MNLLTSRPGSLFHVPANRGAFSGPPRPHPPATEAGGRRPRLLPVTRPEPGDDKAVEAPSGTYLRQGVSAGPVPRGPRISLKALDALVRGLEEKMAVKGPENQVPMDLDSLVIKSLLGGKATQGEPSTNLDLSSYSYVEARALTLDLSLDFQQTSIYQGKAYLSQFHLELHLEQISITAAKWSGASGLLEQRGENSIDTGRYLLSFLDAATFTIFDKHTSLSTTVWGDPHVNLSDMEGDRNGEFSDLDRSDLLTTFSLLDGTKVLFKAPDNGVIEEVFVVQGEKQVMGSGMNGRIQPGREGAALPPLPGTFGKPTALTSDVIKMIEASDSVLAGGDGNDWLNQAGEIVWGG